MPTSVSSPRPLVAVPADHRLIDGRWWHMVATEYVDALVEVARVMPVIIPAIGSGIPQSALLASVDGVVLPGSRSNVHPELYGARPSPASEPYDEARDATTLPLITATLETGVPMLAICRGFQELNVALGGTLISEIQELPGRMDHRSPQTDVQDDRYAIRQSITVSEAGCLAAVVGAGEHRVNSLHRQGIGHLSERLRIEALAPDGTIEAVSVENARAFAIGVQWHPEYWAASDGTSRAILEAFGEAARRRHAERTR